MKISCLPISFYNTVDRDEMTCADWVNMAKRIEHLNACDFGIAMLKNRTPKYLSDLRKTIENSGRPLTMVTTYPDYTNPCPERRKKEFLFSEADIAVAAELGASYVRILGGQRYPGVSEEDLVKLAVDGILTMEDAGKKYGIQLVYENHPGCAGWTYEDVSHTAATFMSIFEGIKSSSVGVNFDTGNAVTSGFDVIKLMDEIFDKIKTFHITDFQRSPRGKVYIPIGRGVVPNKEIIRKAIKRGFDGWFCIEETGFRGLTGILESVDYVYECGQNIK